MRPAPAAATFSATLVAAALLIAPAAAFAGGKTVGGARFPGATSPGAKSLRLVGAGLRTKWMVKVYGMGVYQATPKRSARHLIRANEEKFIWIKMLRTIAGGKMRSAIDDGLEENVSGAVRARIKGNISKLKRSFPSSIPKGANIGFWYRPGRGTVVRFGQVNKVTMAGKETMSALWSIWFGKEPADGDLKDEVLGK